jgi:uncharacterized protein (DUF983 family)
MEGMTRYWKLLGRALRLACPLCGQGSLFAGLFRMHTTCPHCGVKFEREPGLFLGSIYINYGVTAVITVVTYLVMFFNKWLYEWQRMAIVLSIAVLLPLLLHRHARSLWAGFDQWYDPRPDEV